MKKLLIPFKRIFGIIIFLLAVLIAGFTVYPYLLMFYGIDKTTKWMDKNILPIIEWSE